MPATLSMRQATFQSLSDRPGPPRSAYPYHSKVRLWSSVDRSPIKPLHHCFTFATLCACWLPVRFSACYNGPNGLRQRWMAGRGGLEPRCASAMIPSYRNQTGWQLYDPRNTLPLGIRLLIQGVPDFVKGFLLFILGAEVPPCPEPRGRAYAIHLQVEVGYLLVT